MNNILKQLMERSFQFQNVLHKKWILHLLPSMECITALKIFSPSRYMIKLLKSSRDHYLSEYSSQIDLICPTICFFFCMRKYRWETIESIIETCTTRSSSNNHWRRWQLLGFFINLYQLPFDLSFLWLTVIIMYDPNKEVQMKIWRVTYGIR